jgi:hypothetical protein
MKIVYLCLLCLRRLERAGCFLAPVADADVGSGEASDRLELFKATRSLVELSRRGLAVKF